MKRILILGIIASAMAVTAGSASAASVDFTNVLVETNFGTVYNPAGDLNLTITARGNVDPSNTGDHDPNAPAFDTDDGTANTIVLSPDPGGGKKFAQKGLGVQEPDGNSGSSGISGKGHEENEEAIFSFTQSVTISSTVLGLSDIKFADDDPILFLFVDRLSDYVRIDSTGIESQFSFMSGDAATLMGEVAFIDLIGLATVSVVGGAGVPLFASDTISSFTLRNSADELYVSSLDTTVVPVPAALPLFLSGLLGLGIIARRKAKKATA